MFCACLHMGKGKWTFSLQKKHIHNTTSDLCPSFKATSTDPPNTRVTLMFVISINQELNSTITSYYGYLSDNGQFHS